ncbi:5-hydroxytryptamine receptor 1F [Desmophyllum pertusum]|uniref:5-hydroxytryptamine receptor 1F n=1 Tax=Desmophyllum pertusum TaxID=174260 RepID=A0A9W9YRT0_9CNID|nr:5-hydroxytryptamine receptor 1F [Desmophyllum pertusum]
MNNISANVSDDSHHGHHDDHGTQEFHGYLFFSPAFTVFIITALIVIIVAAIIGNTLVCIATGLSPNLRKANTSLFIVSLAVSDILTAILVIPFDVYIILTNGLWHHGEAACNIWTTAYLLAVPTSNLTLLILSIDRYLTLSEPLNQFRGRQFMTRGRILCYIAALWVYSLACALLPLTGWEIWRLKPKSVGGGICIFNGSRLYNILVSVLHFIAPALAMCVIYIMIYRQIRRHTRAVHPIDSPVAQNTQASFLLQRNIRAAKRIAVIVSVFLLCWVPYSILSIIGNLCAECLQEIPQEVFYVTLMAGYLNSSLNPILYSFNNRNFMDSYKRLYRMIRRACGRFGSLK